MNRPILPDRWDTLSPLIDAALDRQGDDRRAFVDSACRHDPALRAEVEALLAQCDRPAPLLDREALEGFSPLVKDGATPLPETLAGRYLIERKIGAGGMATVYLARDVRHDRSVAVKVLKRDLGSILGAERFLAEIKVTAALQHPNVLPLYDSGEFLGTLYYVMPFVDGETLRERLTRGDLSLDSAIGILRDMCKAMAYAHSRGVIHRDIKPENVLLGAHGGGAIVADFGIAKAVSASSIVAAHPVTTVGVTVGTPAYMSPEQAAGDRTLDHRADIYAFGVVAYEMLAGRTPFEGDSQQLLAAHISETPVDLGQRRPNLRAALASIVMRCLAKRPADRPQSADDVLRTLDELNRSADAYVPKRRSRRAIAMLGATGAMLVIVALAAAMSLARHRSNTLNPRRVVVAPFVNLTGDTSLNVLGPMLAQGVASGLEALDSIEVVGLLGTLRGVDGAPRTIVTVADLRALGAETRAGRVVWGSYTRHGDTLRIQSEILSAGDGRVELTIDPVSTPWSSPMPGIDRVRDAVEVALEATGARRSIGSIGHTPSLAAFREFMAGWEAGASIDGAKDVAGRAAALPHWVKATQLDSLFMLAYWSMGEVLWNQNRFDELDSLVRVLEPRRASFSSLERDLFEDIAATARQDWEWDFRSVRSLLRRDPTVQYAYVVAFTAKMTNRPNDGLAALSQYPIASGVWDRYGSYWLEAGRLDHMVGRYDAELARSVAGSARVRPGTQAAVSVFTRYAFALAALGRVRELKSLVDSAVISWSPGSPETPSNWYLQVARELLAHGHPREADAYVASGMAWDSSHSERAGAAARREALGDLLLMAGQLDSARGIYEGLLADSTSGVGAYGRRLQRINVMGRLGIISARLDDTATAIRMMRQLDSIAAMPHTFGHPLQSEASIAAWLGRKDEAMRLLTAAYASGVGFGPSWHMSLEFEPLWTYPAFKEFLRPKG